MWDPLEPAAEADQRASGAVDVSDPVQQPAPAAQRPGIGEVAGRLDQRTQPRLAAVERPLPACEPILGSPVPDGRMPVLAVLGHARNPRSRTVTTPSASSTSPSPASSISSCSWQLPGQPPSHHSRSPWMVDTATPWTVWVWRLASYSTFWLTQALGRCTRVASPSTTTASLERAISPRRSHNSAGVATKVPSGWQNPSAASLPSSRSMLSPTSVLEIPTIRPARRYHSPSKITAATASSRTSKASGGLPPMPGGRGGSRRRRRPVSQASMSAGSEERGQYDTRTGPPGAGHQPR
jgi:hypothetical protein